jgi:hypothetical protein
LWAKVPVTASTDSSGKSGGDAFGIGRGHSLAGDHYTGVLLGVAPNSLAIRDGRHITAADVYLDPVHSRTKLTVMSEARVHELVCSEKRRAALVPHPPSHSWTSIY